LSTDLDVIWVVCLYRSFYGWHIDHIRPVSSFDLSDPAQVQECFHFSNLQPLWAIDNIKKSDSWDIDPQDTIFF
jgi:hypothetical protein